MFLVFGELCLSAVFFVLSEFGVFAVFSVISEFLCVCCVPYV